MLLHLAVLGLVMNCLGSSIKWFFIWMEKMVHVSLRYPFGEKRFSKVSGKGFLSKFCTKLSIVLVW